MLLMSLIGTKRTWPARLMMSVPEGRTDLAETTADFRK